MQDLSPSALGIGLTEAVIIGAAAVVVLVLLGSIILAMRPKVRPLNPKQYNAELFKRRMALEETAFEILNEVRVKDSHGRILKVDHVVRLPASVLLITSAPPDAVGQVRVNAQAGQWKYVTPDGRITAFTNPVVEVHPLIHAIRARFPLLRVRVLTVFPNSADFGPRPPRVVCRSEDLIDLMKDLAREDGIQSKAMEEAWPALSAAFKAQK